MTRFIMRHPLFCLALLSGVVYGASILLWRNQQYAEAAFFLRQVWFWIGHPFALVAQWLSVIAPNLPQWADFSLIIALGLLPYVLVDQAIIVLRRVVANRHGDAGLCPTVRG